MDRTFKLVLIIGALLLLISPVSAWWDTDYLYRQEITISNPPSVSDFQAPFTITYNAHMDADFADARFVDDDDTTELDYWIESYTASTSASGFVELSDTGSTIYLYYGNDEAASASDGEETFEFFDDFPGVSIDAEKWTIVNNNGLSVGSSILVISSGSSNWGTIRSIDTYGPDCIIEASVNHGSGSIYTSGISIGVSPPNGVTLGSSMGFATRSQFESAIYTGVGISDRYWAIPPRSVASTSTLGDLITGPSGNTWYIHSLAVPDADKIKYRRDGGGWTVSTNYNGITSPGVLSITHYRAYTSLSIDWILIRKYAATEPSFAYGEEEESGPGVVAFPGCSNPPTDTDADTLYDDINGNSRWDFNDIIVYFQNLAWCEANQPVELFDWNSNSRCDYDDVYNLWLEEGAI